MWTCIHGMGPCSVCGPVTEYRLSGSLDLEGKYLKEQLQHAVEVEHFARETAEHWLAPGGIYWFTGEKHAPKMAPELEPKHYLAAERHLLQRLTPEQARDDNVRQGIQ